MRIFQFLMHTDYNRQIKFMYFKQHYVNEDWDFLREDQNLILGKEG